MCSETLTELTPHPGIKWRGQRCLRCVLVLGVGAPAAHASRGRLTMMFRCQVVGRGTVPTPAHAGAVGRRLGDLREVVVVHLLLILTL